MAPLAAKAAARAGAGNGDNGHEQWCVELAGGARRWHQMTSGRSAVWRHTTCAAGSLLAAGGMRQRQRCVRFATPAASWQTNGGEEHGGGVAPSACCRVRTSPRCCAPRGGVPSRATYICSCRTSLYALAHFISWHAPCGLAFHPRALAANGMKEGESRHEENWAWRKRGAKNICGAGLKAWRARRHCGWRFARRLSAQKREKSSEDWRG
jgi:hypothetical protein